MTEMTKSKNKKTLFIILGIIGGIALLILLILFSVVLIGILASILTPTLLNASDKAKAVAVKANVSAAASTVTTRLIIYENKPEFTVNASIKDLQQAGTPNDLSDDPKSPFDSNLPAYDNKPGPGVVEIKLDKDLKKVKITGYGKDESVVLITKTIEKPI